MRERGAVSGPLPRMGVTDGGEEGTCGQRPRLREGSGPRRPPRPCSRLRCSPGSLPASRTAPRPSPCAPCPRAFAPPVLGPRPAPFPHEAVPAHRRAPRPSRRHGFTHLPSVFSSRLVSLSRIDHLVFYLRLRESARSLAGDWGAPTAQGCSPLLQFNASPPFCVWGRPAPGRGARAIILQDPHSARDR